MNTITRQTHREQQAAARFAAVTPESIHAAKVAAWKERQIVEQTFGVTFNPFREGEILRDRRTR